MAKVQSTPTRRGLLAASAAATLAGTPVRSRAITMTDPLVAMLAELRELTKRAASLLAVRASAESRMWQAERSLETPSQELPKEIRREFEAAEAAHDSADRDAIDCARQMARIAPKSIAGVDAMLAMLAEDDLDYGEVFADQDDEFQTIAGVAIASLRRGVARMMEAVHG